jgi:hypothetical protein
MTVFVAEGDRSSRIASDIMTNESPGSPVLQANRVYAHTAGGPSETPTILECTLVGTGLATLRFSLIGKLRLNEHTSGY